MNPRGGFIPLPLSRRVPWTGLGDASQISWKSRAEKQHYLHTTFLFISKDHINPDSNNNKFEEINWEFCQIEISKFQEKDLNDKIYLEIESKVKTQYENDINKYKDDISQFFKGEFSDVSTGKIELEDEKKIDLLR